MKITRELIQDPAYHPFVKDEYIGYINEMLEGAEKAIIPAEENVFRALNVCPLDKIKVVIIGQDCYHTIKKGVMVADGLCFSSNIDSYCPPSLARIKKHFGSELEGNSLLEWGKQGVLLLNSALTVCQGDPGCHLPIWEFITDDLIKGISETRQGLVFMLWGKYAKKKAALIDSSKHLILEGVHPSPFTGNEWFANPDFAGEANKYLEGRNQTPIEW